MSLDYQVRIVLRWLTKAHEAFFVFVFLVNDVADDVHLCHIVALGHRVCLQIDSATTFVPFITHCQLALDSLIASSKQLIQIALEVTDKLVFVLILIEYLHSDHLVSFKFVVDKEELWKVRIEALVNCLCAANFAPLLLFLRFCIDDCVRITLATQVHVGNVSA